MIQKFSIPLSFILFSISFISTAVFADQTSMNEQKIYAGYYSREGNDAKMAQTTGNNTYIKFYPGKRIIRLYIPYPYSKTVKSGEINAAFNSAAKKSTGSAYIRDNFGVMKEPVVAHLDFYHWVNEQVMYDCSKPKPCKITFSDNAMTVIKPGIVLEHKINYGLVSK